MTYVNQMFSRLRPAMTLHDRFSYMKYDHPAQNSVDAVRVRAIRMNQQLGSTRNQQLMMQLEKRVAAIAALKIKKKSIRQRLGTLTPLNKRGVKDRLTLPNRGRQRGRQRGNLRRTQSLQSLKGGNLHRSRSMQSLNEIPIGRGRSRSRSRGRTPLRGQRSNSVGRNPNQRAGSVGPQRRPSTSGVNQRPNTSNQSDFKQQLNASFNQRLGFKSGFRNSRGNNQGRGNRIQRNANFNRFRGGGRAPGGGGGIRGNQNQNTQFRGTRGGGVRGRGRGRGAARGGGRGRLNRRLRDKTPLPSKEELDMQLDQYMASKRSLTDRELLEFMVSCDV